MATIFSPAAGKSYTFAQLTENDLFPVCKMFRSSARAQYSIVIVSKSRCLFAEALTFNCHLQNRAVLLF